MKEELRNTLMEKYPFFYRDPEKKVYRKYPEQAISEAVSDVWYPVINRLCEELSCYIRELEYPAHLMFILIGIKDRHLQIYYLLEGGDSEVSNQIDELIDKYERIEQCEQSIME